MIPVFDSTVNQAASSIDEAVASERGRRMNARERVLARLQRGTASSSELNRICFRYGARIKELREDGYKIETTPDTTGEFVYNLSHARAL